MEGLSIAAVTYYVVGLVGYVAKGFKAGGARLDPDLVTGIAIPVVAVAVALGLRQVRRFLKRRRKGQGGRPGRAAEGGLEAAQSG